LGSIATISQGLNQCSSGQENDPAYARFRLKSKLSVSFSKLPVPRVCRELESQISSAPLVTAQHSQGRTQGLQDTMRGSSTAAGHRNLHHLHMGSGAGLLLNFPDIQTGRFFPAKAKIIQYLSEKMSRLNFVKVMYITQVTCSLSTIIMNTP